MAESLLIVEKIVKSYYGIKALDNVDFHLDKGEVLCLAGTNGSGKSTLIKCISGVESFDSGTVTINGVKSTEISVIGAIEAGVQVIYQDLSLFPELTVMENICLEHQMAQKKKLVDWQHMKSTAKELLSRLGADILVDTDVQDLSVGKKQVVAIARALAHKAKVIIMDEPTAALTRSEVKNLLAIIKQLKHEGIAIIFVSHKLEELLEIADRFTVLRDGVKIGDYDPITLDAKKISYLMTGKYVMYRFHDETPHSSKPVLEVSRLTREPHYRDISFSLLPGEIVGITGLLGSGRTELALSLFGLNPSQSGEIKINGKSVNIDSPYKAIKYGIGLIPEDRHGQGLFADHTITTNIVASILKKLKGFCGWLSTGKATEIAECWTNNLNIKLASCNAPAKSLSGGNQQKMVLAKWLATEPTILILDSPTVGIDVGSKSEIYDLICSLAKNGMGIILISDDLDEVVNNCNRVYVMKNGSFGRDYSGEERTYKNFEEAINN